MKCSFSQIANYKVKCMTSFRNSLGEFLMDNGLQYITWLFKGLSVDQASRTVFTRVEMATTATNRPRQIHNSSSRTMSPRYWSPQDDGIQITLPSHPGLSPSREDVDTYIRHFLDGQSHTTKRLPVFNEICSP